MSQNPSNVQILVRSPVEIKIWLELEAARNGASQNSEIVSTFPARIDAGQKAGRSCHGESRPFVREISQKH